MSSHLVTVAIQSMFMHQLSYLAELEKAVLVYREHGGEAQVGKVNHGFHSCHPMRTFLFGTYPSHTCAGQIRKLGVEEEGIK